ncbi:MAG: hypothetical protein IJA02_10610 [Clostridia bacterium]|nr:hypothetical protein [Clostridia bacterium]
MITDKEIYSYLKAVQRNCPTELKSKIKADLENNLYDFREENPQLDMSQLIERFGSPEAYAAGFAQAMPADEQVKAVKKAHLNKWLIALVLVLFVILACVITIFAISDKDINATYYYTEEIIDEGTQVNN